VNADFDRRMGEYYRRVDAAIAAHRPTCVNRGACCKFAEYGHKLYVTAVELAYFLDHQRAEGVRPIESDHACPYQAGGMCTAREHRPLGCRVFFCDPAAQEWQPAEYERGLAELKQIGREFGIEYRYQEWLSALRSAGDGGTP
jgi:Fe-S-cluster containining protein